MAFTLLRYLRRHGSSSSKFRFLGRYSSRAMPLRRGLLSPLRLLFVMQVFVGPVPIRKDDDSGRKSFALPPFFRFADFKVDVVSVLQLFVEVALEPISPFGVVFDDLLEVIEELTVCVHTGDFDIGPRMPNENTLKERN
jgi:hypothetical protein